MVMLLFPAGKLSAVCAEAARLIIKDNPTINTAQIFKHFIRFSLYLKIMNSDNMRSRFFDAPQMCMHHVVANVSIAHHERKI